MQHRFQTALNTALVDGHPPSRTGGLGPQTWAAVTRVATAHPDATAEMIASAYDTFRREHDG